jgi:hypothetical protein
MITRAHHLSAGLLALLALAAGCAGGSTEEPPATTNNGATVNNGLPANNGGRNNDQECPPDSCALGDVICIGTSEVFRCESLDSGCTAFSLVESCAAGLRCVAGECQGADACVDRDGDGRGTGCSLGADCDDNDADRYAGAAEACDDKDNDCDGESDEGACDADCDPQDCEPGVRECTNTTTLRECNRDADGCGVWSAPMSCGGACEDGACQSGDCDDPDGDQRGPGCALGQDCDQTDPNVYNGAEELCDGEDNDCDGDMDEGFNDLGQRCMAGRGACERTGTFECSPSGFTTRCSASPGPAVAEVCGDRVDNDCDGTVDDGFEEIGDPCTIRMGDCTLTGTLNCRGEDFFCDDNDQTCPEPGNNGGGFACLSTNDRSPNAISLASGGSANAALCSASQTDWYDLGVLSSGQRINLTLTANNFANTGEPVRFQLFGNANVDFLLSSISANPRNNLTYTATSSTRHYIQVLYSGTFPGGTLEYTLQRAQ